MLSSSSLPLLLFSINMLFTTSILLSLGLVAQATSSHHKQDAKLGAVASESSVCSQIGVDTLEKGGNAADAVSCNWMS